MENLKEHSTDDDMDIRKKEFRTIAKIHINKLFCFLEVNFIAINDTDLKYEFNKEFKQHLYYNIFQIPPGVLSSKNDLTFVKDLTWVIRKLGLRDFDLYYNKDEFY